MRRFGIWKEGKQVGEGVLWSQDLATYRVANNRGDYGNVETVIVPGELQFSGTEVRWIDEHDDGKPCPRQATIGRLERDNGLLIEQRRRAMIDLKRATLTPNTDVRSVYDALSELTRRPESEPMPPASQQAKPGGVLDRAAARVEKFGKSAAAERCDTCGAPETRYSVQEVVTYGCAEHAPSNAQELLDWALATLVSEPPPEKGKLVSEQLSERIAQRNHSKTPFFDLFQRQLLHVLDERLGRAL
ncbi:MAG TPA: hypothetical protein VGK73_36460 [Polyangiaceae bacterium]